MCYSAHILFRHFHISNPRCTSFSSAPCRKTRAARKKKPGSFLVLTFGQSWEITRFSKEYRLSFTNNFALRSLGYNFESHQAELLIRGEYELPPFTRFKKIIFWKDTQIPIVNPNAKNVCNKKGTLSEAVNPSEPHDALGFGLSKFMGFSTFQVQEFVHQKYVQS